jgi:hypothetical protein
MFVRSLQLPFVVSPHRLHIYELWQPHIHYHHHNLGLIARGCLICIRLIRGLKEDQNILHSQEILPRTGFTHLQMVWLKV